MEVFGKALSFFEALWYNAIKTSWTEKERYGEYQRAWKGYDFEILNNLEDEKLIGGSTHKAKSTYVTDEEIKKAKELMKKYNIKCEQ